MSSSTIKILKMPHIRRSFSLLLFFLSVSLLYAQSDPLLGFSRMASDAQLRLEQRFDSSLQAVNQDAWMKRLSARPHHIGSAQGKANAEFMAAQFRSWGYDVAIEEYRVLFPTPRLRQLELLAPQTYKAGLAEPPLGPAAASTAEQLPPYNCYSVDGDVTGELVFVNYGIPADYEELEKLGIDVKGKIVIAKYGGSWRGIKPKVAAEKGAIGCIIYSDPRNDGFFQGDVYPEGAFKNEYGVQRGSVLDMPLFPGDPLTPGYAAKGDAPRIDRAQTLTLTKIPVLPISYKDAEPLLRALGGPMAPEAWRGALPISYHLGPGPAKVRLRLAFNWDLHPIYNVIAKMPGREFPDEWVIRGNHHDAWVNGASDPLSGIVAMMEEARGVAALTQTGWRPKRTIVYCAWDGEEAGLLGSNEWTEDHAEELRRKAVAYINTDATGRGFLGAGGSHTLEKFFDQITRAVLDPQTGLSVFERRKALDLVQGKPELTSFKLSPLGAGSDYSPFFQHLGIAALDLGFGGENPGGEYHSAYDTYDHFTRFKDPGFRYGIALSKVAGRSTMRLANAEYLPFEFQRLGSTIGSYVDELIRLGDDMREKTRKENRLIEEGLYAAAADPTKPFVVPALKADVPHLNFAPLKNAMETVNRQAAAFDKAMRSRPDPDDASAARLNARLRDMERALMLERGLPGRPWYRHQVYAPGFYTGYGVKTLPGVREAMELRQWEAAQKEIEQLAQVLENYSREIEKLTRWER
jgi:N-acetylated-alpha-linked acidic dipeptidase